MAGEWTSTQLGEVASVQSGYAFKSSDWVESGIPVVKIANVKDGNLDMGGCSFVSPRIADAAPGFALNSGDILIAMTGYIGDVAWVRKLDLPAVLNQRVGLFAIKDRNRLDQKFLFYVLRNPETRRSIEAMGYGSAQPNVSPTLIHSLQIDLPPLGEQRAIAHILGTLDDKIELNRRTSATLEAMARALFQSWFVDFDPVRAKLDGRWRRGQSLPGLPAHLYDLFSDRLVDSELGEIPEGWHKATIGNLAEVVGGGTPSTKQSRFWDGGTHCWATPKDMSGLSTPVLLNTERRVTEEGLAGISSGLLPRGTVLLSSRAPIGYLAIAEVPVAINQGFIAMKPQADVSNLYLWLWTQASQDEIVSRANGSTFLEISKANFRPIPLVRPAAQVMAAFDRLVRPTYEKIVACERESRTLAALRDTLLPKLISGELRVTDAERFVAAADLLALEGQVDIDPAYDYKALRQRPAAK